MDTAIPRWVAHRVKGMPFWDRFWEKVDISKGPDGCCEWQANRTQDGYGTITIAGAHRRVQRAARIAYEEFYGSIPPGLEIRHKCDNPPCVNPQHLTVGTHRENIADMVKRGRRAPTDGERNPKAKLTAADVATIRVLGATGESGASIGRRYGFHRGPINKILRGAAWRLSDEPKR